MSPFARSLLALACAALLRAACAQSLCNTDNKGNFPDLVIKLPLIYLNASQGSEIDLYIPDNCQALYQIAAQGEIAQACDEYRAPNVTIYDGLSRVHISRHNPSLHPDATLQVWQYC